MGTEQQQNSNEPSRQQWINNRLNRWVLHDACTEKKNKKMWWNDGSMYRLYACARKKYVSLCTWNLPIPSYLPILNWTRWKINTECRREKKGKSTPALSSDEERALKRVAEHREIISRTSKLPLVSHSHYCTGVKRPLRKGLFENAPKKIGVKGKFRECRPEAKKLPIQKSTPTP